jgi:hypothetical protein
MPSSTTSAASGLIKNHFSDELRSEILNDSLKPGERFVEEKWAARFGVAQASIGEAIATKPVCTRATAHDWSAVFQSPAQRTTHGRF